MVNECLVPEKTGNFLKRNGTKLLLVAAAALALSACTKDGKEPLPSTPTSPSANPGAVRDLIWVMTDTRADEIEWARSGRAERLPTPDDPFPDEAVLIVAKKEDFTGCKQKGVAFVDGGGQVQRGMLPEEEGLSPHPDAFDTDYAARMRLDKGELLATFVCDRDGYGGNPPEPVKTAVVAIFDTDKNYREVPLY